MLSRNDQSKIYDISIRFNKYRPQQIGLNPNTDHIRSQQVLPTNNQLYTDKDSHGRLPSIHSNSQERNIKALS
jgi:hypothetical protein